MSDVNGTQPSPVPAPRKGSRWISILGLLALLAVSIFGGYQVGIGDRLRAESTLVSQQLQAQYDLGVQAIQQGRYEVALQHFQFVIANDPDFPGVQEKLTEVLLAMSFSPTPPIPTITPTPDIRAAEAIFNSALERLNAQDWSGAIAFLDSLRKKDPTYRTVDVDGMYYMALRNRGYYKILNNDCAQINLEGGIYDLTLAERFGPLDGLAESLRTWARLYITGASFWELDWSQVLYYFGQIYPNLPNLMDVSCMTATERYRHAAIKYADQLLAAGDWCGASQYYNLAFLIPSNKNATAVPTATHAGSLCITGGEPGGSGEQPTLEATPTETPTPTFTPETPPP